MEHKKIELEKLDLPFEEEVKEHFINVNCPSCGEGVTAENMELTSKIGKCGNCNALFSLKREVEDLLKITVVREKVDRPEGVEAFYFNNELELELNQPFPVVDIISFSIFPFMFVIGTLIYFLKDVNGGLIAAIISTIFLLKPIYRLIKRDEYKSYLNITKDTIHVFHRPKELKKDKSFSVLNLEQVYVRQTTDGLGLFFVMNGENGQRHEQVLGRIQNMSKLKFIEQEIEQYLGIKNKKVPGEL